jgi:hypothetical protein
VNTSPSTLNLEEYLAVQWGGQARYGVSSTPLQDCC